MSFRSMGIMTHKSERNSHMRMSGGKGEGGQQIQTKADRGRGGVKKG
jgi:hypothetical protein